MKERDPLEVVVFDETEQCPYLPDRLARLPLRLPLAPLGGDQLDERLAAGDRRNGRFLYGTQCPHCQECEPIRLSVDDFQPDATQRRVLRRGDRELTLSIGRPIVDAQRVQLYNLHQVGRGLSSGRRVDLAEYAAFLVETCCDTLEFQYLLDDQLVAVAIADRGASSLSAVYCYFDPSLSRLSLGSYSILKQVEMCRQWKLPHLYLGYYIARNAHMIYKARYKPHERLRNGRWETVSASANS